MGRGTAAAQERGHRPRGAGRGLQSFPAAGDLSVNPSDSSFDIPYSAPRANCNAENARRPENTDEDPDPLFPLGTDNPSPEPGARRSSPISQRRQDTHNGTGSDRGSTVRGGRAE